MGQHQVRAGQGGTQGLGDQQQGTRDQRGSSLEGAQAEDLHCLRLKLPPALLVALTARAQADGSSWSEAATSVSLLPESRSKQARGEQGL